MGSTRTTTWLLAVVVPGAITGGVSIAATKAIGRPHWALLLVTALALVLAPSTTATLVAAKGWAGLIAPATMVGMLG